GNVRGTGPWGYMPGQFPWFPPSGAIGVCDGVVDGFVDVPPDVSDGAVVVGVVLSDVCAMATAVPPATSAPGMAVPTRGCLSLSRCIVHPPPASSALRAALGRARPRSP